MKKIAILGGGESGVGAAILAKDKGYEVFLSDCGSVAQKYADMLDAEGIEWEHGHHTVERILDADEIVKSPGIPLTVPLVRQAIDKAIPVISEIEFAARFTNSKMVCITGSNGKTTTTLLTYHILRAAGVDAGLAGNVGKSLALQVTRDPHEVYVIELSSFQLDNMYDFKADIAIIMNITPDHLDRYDYKMENYVDSKFRILRNMTADDAFIYWNDDPVVARKLATVTTPARRYPFAETQEAGVAAYTACGKVVINTPATSLTMDRDRLSLPGLHNLYNSLAAGLASCLLGVGAASVEKSLSDFGGVEHRLEFTAEIDGVRYINDSKATNVNSTWYALESMKGDNTILILGGKDKGNDYSEIAGLVRQKVKAIVCMGLHNEKIIDFFKDKVADIYDTHSLDDAVETCHRIAKAGDTVLLSPCCASFDLFHSYEERGELFKAKVRSLSTQDK